jgi:hypothetical protein
LAWASCKMGTINVRTSTAFFKFVSAPSKLVWSSYSVLFLFSKDGRTVIVYLLLRINIVKNIGIRSEMFKIF